MVSISKTGRTLRQLIHFVERAKLFLGNVKLKWVIKHSPEKQTRNSLNVNPFFVG